MSALRTLATAVFVSQMCVGYACGRGDGAREHGVSLKQSRPRSGGEPPSRRPVSECNAPTLLPLAVRSVAFDSPGKTAHRFRYPIAVLQAPGRSDALWVVERDGVIREVVDKRVRETPFLDIRRQVYIPKDEYSENGLLSVAFHPGYADNGRFFVLYTARAREPNAKSDEVIAEYQRDPRDPDRATTSGVVRMRIADRALNHNGGTLAFGPKDHFLYAGIGDEGDRCDSFENAQDLASPFGKILRFDVNGASGFEAAQKNPSLGADSLKEIWAYGLRNPRRMSFDRQSGDLYVADVGQDREEEVDIQPASSRGGENYGWPAFEGAARATSSGCEHRELVQPARYKSPALTYPHASRASVVLSGGKSITGGYVYRGEQLRELDGVYLYGDFVSNGVGAFRFCGTRASPAVTVDDLSHLPAASGLVSFGEDNAGEMYLVFLVTGTVYAIVPRN